MKKLIICLILLFVTFGCSSRPIPFELGDTVNPPKGCRDFRSRGGHCILNYKEEQELFETFLDVKYRFVYVSDYDRYLEREYWTFPSEMVDRRGNYLTDIVEGDCEDFAILMRDILKSKGIPSRLVICLTENGSAHVVLDVYNGYILDMRYDNIMNREDLPYEWLMISGYEPGDMWHEIKPIGVS